MSILTPRQRGLAAVAVVLVAVASVTALTGHVEWSLLTMAVLAGAACLLLLDLRYRQQVVARSLQRLEAATDTLETSVSDGLHDLRMVVQDSTVRVAALESLVRNEAGTSGDRHDEVTRKLARLDYEPVNEVQALLQLLPKVPDTPPLPGVGGWALSASSLLSIWHLVEQERPTTILECGSGTSTLWLAYAARVVPGARVVALEHKVAFARQTRELLAAHGLQDVAEVRDAPLQRVDIDGEHLPWYDPASIADIGDVGLLVVDGPPKSVGPLARYPALPLLRARLAPGAAVVVDDAHRPGEQEALTRWRERYDIEPDRDLSRDAVLLRCPTTPT